MSATGIVGFSIFPVLINLSSTGKTAESMRKYLTLPVKRTFEYTIKLHTCKYVVLNIKKLTNTKIN